MYWPRLQLTKKESERWASYFEPSKLQRAVLYRTYAGEINLTSTNKEDTENIQISRRSRIFAMTVSGDVHNTEVQIYDSGGEQYTMGFTPLMNMFLGNIGDPRGSGSFDPALDGLFTGRRIAMGAAYAMYFSIAPHIFDPNIVLEPNQTLSVKGRNLIQLRSPVSDEVPSNLVPMSHVSFNFHVWEFPVE